MKSSSSPLPFWVCPGSQLRVLAGLWLLIVLRSPIQGQELAKLDFVPVTCADTGTVTTATSEICVTYYPVSENAKRSLLSFSGDAYSLNYSSVSGGLVSPSVRPSSVSVGMSFLFRIPSHSAAGSYIISLSGPAATIPTVPFSVFSSRDLSGDQPVAESIEIVNQHEFKIYGRFPLSLEAEIGVYVVAADGSMTYSDRSNGLLTVAAVSSDTTILRVAQSFPADGTAVVVTQKNGRLSSATISNVLRAGRPTAPRK